ncbi:complement factor H-related protein 3-like isoform X2 [Mixophyes fleayi]|uniref:complement factor H-related protein 3-like isoform X2 n=1 Tax=Mixophyes fleayi TaxID=3061075 RepID=UPI003F4E2B3B
MPLFGFLLLLTSVLSCSAAPTLEKDLGCTAPERMSEAILDGDWNDDRYPTGTIAAYSCLPGYNSLGSIRKVCIEGQWEFIGTRGQCRKLGCTAPERMSEAVLHGDWNEDRYPTGKIAIYSCLPGYSSIGSIRKVCIEGQWEFIGTSGQCRRNSCGNAPTVENAVIQGEKTDFKHGENANYQCTYGFTFAGGSSAECIEGKWGNTPTCVRIGESCGPAPVVQFGDTKDLRKIDYESGSSVEYKCPAFHVLRGNKIVKCMNGFWGDAPVCLEPCAVKETDMKQNNIQLRYGRNQKLYSEHGDTVSFACLNAYDSPPGTNMRATCDQGVLQYPKCFKKGFCLLQSTIMISSNIYYNKSTVVELGETIAFECNEGMFPENGLQAKCEWNGIQYPKCIATTTSCGPAPIVLNANIRTKKNVYASGEKALYECKFGYSLEQFKKPEAVCENTQWKDIPECRRIGEHCGPAPVVQFGDTKDIRKSDYESGSSVEYTCPAYYVLQGNKIVTCLNGVWETKPVCLEPCTAKETDMKQNNIQLRYGVNWKLYSEHGDTVSFACLNGYDSPPGTNMRATCDQGVLQYPKCFKKV